MSFNSRILSQVGTSLRSVLGAYADAPAPVPSLRSGTVAASRLHGVRARPRPCGCGGACPPDWDNGWSGKNGDKWLDGRAGMAARTERSGRWKNRKKASAEAQDIDGRLSETRRNDAVTWFPTLWSGTVPLVSSELSSVPP